MAKNNMLQIMIDMVYYTFEYMCQTDWKIDSFELWYDVLKGVVKVFS